ncbi:hypothetical protein GALMADRAFT_228506 [Galerina marginata CBS 339.88]|uniref:Hydrophobin n=1 Tax=Galerina marginata (strain CBS 339.88) TaxID=685588 RepID=A0A067SYN5_GALM3|nr:hypothetical protein GALMADRAFT_228506 [Galerina marginata CBS 339.88]
MFSKFATLFIATLGALSASALVTNTVYSCNSGPVQCCGTLQTPQEYSAAGIASLVGVVVSDITGQVGLQCNAITGIGAGTGANCASAPVCCEHNFTNQLIGVNCNPAIVGA